MPYALALCAWPVLQSRPPRPLTTRAQLGERGSRHRVRAPRGPDRNGLAFIITTGVSMGEVVSRHIYERPHTRKDNGLSHLEQSYGGMLYS